MDESTNFSSINKRGTNDNCANLTEVATQYINDYNNMVTSVDQYGGFYIGRYEITGNVGSPTEKAGEPMVDQNWYTFYNQCMTFGKKNNNGNIITESGMIYGALWDATMQWLAKNDIDVGHVDWSGSYRLWELSAGRG